MEIKINENRLESTAYRRLFECAKEVGPGRLFHLVQDMIALQNADIINESVLNGMNRLIELTKRNKETISYIRKYNKELKIGNFKLANLQTYKLLGELLKDVALLDKYIENARILEELKIGAITLVNNDALEYFNEASGILYFKNETGQITDIIRSFTDGRITEITPEMEDENSDVYNIRFKIRSTPINKEGKIIEIPPYWLLKTENHKYGVQHRYFFTNGFNFDASKLPTEEELSGYELPSYLKLQK